MLIGHDGIGVENYQRGRADHLTEHGYVALAMDYHGDQTFFGDVTRWWLGSCLAVPGADRGRFCALGYGAGAGIALTLLSAGVPFTALAAVHPARPSARPQGRSRPLRVR